MATDMYGISAEGLEQIILFHDKDLMEVVVAANPHMRVLVGGDGSYSEKEFPGVYIAAVKAAQERDLRPCARGHKDPPRADKHDTQGLLREYMAHMREVMHHQDCAYFVLLNLLDELIHDR